MDTRNAWPGHLKKGVGSPPFFTFWQKLKFVPIVPVALLCSGCLVLSLQPLYEANSIAWDEQLLGEWRAAEDRVTVTIERAEWRSYRVRYRHPVESAEFTAYLTAIGDEYFLDLMPVRGHDYGAVLIPSHLILRVRRDGQRRLVAPLDYDRLAAGVESGRAPKATFDQKQNVILTDSTTELRARLRTEEETLFGDEVVFERTGAKVP
jgi:hypothetical protein